MSRMCWGCGYDVADDEDECPNCGDKVPSGKCPFCGADMYPSYHHICRLCGRDERDFKVPYEPLPFESDRSDDKTVTAAETPTQKVSPEQEDHLETRNMTWQERYTWLRQHNGWETICYGSLAVLSIASLWVCLVVLFCAKYGPFLVRFFEAIIGVAISYIGFRILRSLCRATVREKSIILGICYAILWVPTAYGVYQLGASQWAYYALRPSVMDRALQYGQTDGDWGKASAILEVYRDESAAYESLYYYCRAKQEIADHEPWSKVITFFQVELLPAAVQEDARQIQRYAVGDLQYQRAKDKFEQLKKMKALIGYEELQRNELQAYTDEDVPPSEREEAVALRQDVAQYIANNKPIIEAQREEYRQKKAAEEAAAKADARRMAQQPKSQKARDEEDYNRGYDDGRFSASEGIWEDYDETESQAYINGYQDGQGEAREEMGDHS